MVSLFSHFLEDDVGSVDGCALPKRAMNQWEYYAWPSKFNSGLEGSVQSEL
jgi:hypothetical protein